MPIVNSIVSTIVVICILCECVETSASDGFTITKYIGIWYRVGLLLPKDPPNRGIMCEWFTSQSNNKCDGCFDETYQMLSDGRNSTRAYGSGLVVNSEVHVSYPTITKSLFTFAVTEYNDGDELILRDKSNRGNCKVLSRRTSISKKTKGTFEQIAENAGLRAVYIINTSC